MKYLKATKVLKESDNGEEEVQDAINTMIWLATTLGGDARGVGGRGGYG